MRIEVAPHWKERFPAMTFACPYCKESQAANALSPGRHTVHCASCAKRFVLIVPEDAQKRLVVAALKSELGEALPSDHGAEARRQPETSAASRPDAEGPPRLNPAGSEPAPSSTSQQHEDHSSTSSPDRAHGLIQSSLFAAIRHWFPPPGTVAGVPATLGDYRVIQELGRGGAGVVCLARQSSLDRNVALKVMRRSWADDAKLVSRFVRNAYAAAQLSHANLAQIYEFGEEKGTSFFSMEFVAGRSLAAVLREQGKLDPQVAAVLIVQAARGLKFAHDRGMIHFDIKPANLLLDDLGLLKVANLGLVNPPEEPKSSSTKPLPGAGAAQPMTAPVTSGALTAANQGIGTPEYMAPELAGEPLKVDHRADIYALGCTFCELVTGSPPFQGATPAEVIARHSSTPLQVAVEGSPKALSPIILKMMAKSPDGRYLDLDAAISDLEQYLVLPKPSAFTPLEEHASVLEEAVQEFHAPSLIKRRALVLLGFFGGCGLLTLLFALLRLPLLAGGFLGFGFFFAVAYFLLSGSWFKTPLFLKVRALVLGASTSDRLTALAGFALLVMILVVFKMFWVWVAFGVAAGLLAFAFTSEVDKKLAADRSEPVAQVKQMLKSMRLQGVDEAALRQFVCSCAGNRWEEFYEALFGYEAKLAARQQWRPGRTGRARPKFAAWRDPIARWLEAKLTARRDAQARVTLEAVEGRRLVAQGVNLLTARRQSRRVAEAMVTRAAELREELAATARMPALPKEVLRAQSVRSIIEVAAKPEDYLVDKEKGLTPRDPVMSQWTWLLGPRSRFLLAIVLLGGCLMWMHQNDLISGRELQDLATEAYRTQDTTKVQVVAKARFKAAKVAARQAKPLALPLAPTWFTNQFRDFNSGVAGLVLLLSATLRGWRLSLFFIPGAAVILLGRSLGIPAIGPIRPEWSSLVLGLAIAAAGLVFGRGR
jgi:serine/threonine protein kinase